MRLCKSHSAESAWRSPIKTQIEDDRSRVELHLSSCLACTGVERRSADVGVNTCDGKPNVVIWMLFKLVMIVGACHLLQHAFKLRDSEVGVLHGQHAPVNARDVKMWTTAGFKSTPGVGQNAVDSCFILTNGHSC